jgi:hypothetical protein
MRIGGPSGQNSSYPTSLSTRFYIAAGVPEFGADSKLRFDLLALAVLIEYSHPLNQQRQMMVFYLRRVGRRWQWRMEEGLREKLRQLAERTRNEKPRPGEVSASEAYAVSERWDDAAESQQAPSEAAYQRFTREHPARQSPRCRAREEP